MKVTSVRNMTMTKAEALKIQSEQVAFLSQFRADLPAIVASMTKADALEDGRLYPVQEINEYIPRGADIERLCFSNTDKHLD